MKNKDKTEKTNWQPLRELALNTPYTMGYLSLMARRKQLKVKKIGRVWHSTMENIKEFEEKMQQRKELRKKQLQESYREKVKREVLKEIEEETNNEETTPLAATAASSPIGSGTGSYSRGGKNFSPSGEGESPKGEGVGGQEEIEIQSPLERGVLSSDDTIFDEVQKELEEVLQEIRNRERRLRQEYLAYRGVHGSDGVETYGNAALAREKQETEEISENLIMDLGKLLNTANKIHEEEASGEITDNTDNSTYGEISIPVKNQNASRGHERRRHGGIHTMGMDLPGRKNQPRENADKARNIGHEDNFISVPYNSFPFERQRGSSHPPSPEASSFAKASADKPADKSYGQGRFEPMSQSNQNKLLLFIAGLLVFIASVLIILVMFG